MNLNKRGQAVLRTEIEREMQPDIKTNSTTDKDKNRQTGTNANRQTGRHKTRELERQGTLERKKVTLKYRGTTKFIIKMLRFFPQIAFVL